MAYHGVADLSDAVSVSTHACLASLVLAGLHVVCLWSRRGCCSGFVGACLSRLMVGFFGVGSLALQQVFAGSDVVVLMPFLVLVGNVPVALGRHGTF